MKTTVTKIAAIAIAFLTMATAGFAQPAEHMPYSVIAIVYTGPSDGYLFPMLISDSKAGAEWYRRAMMDRFLAMGSEIMHPPHAINSSLLKNLIASVYTFENSEKTHIREYDPAVPLDLNFRSGSFAIFISIVTPKENNSFLYNWKEALSLLEAMHKVCSNDESLSKDIAFFQDYVRRSTPSPRN